MVRQMRRRWQTWWERRKTADDRKLPESADWPLRSRLIYIYLARLHNMAYRFIARTFTFSGRAALFLVLRVFFGGGVHCRVQVFGRLIW